MNQTHGFFYAFLKLQLPHQPVLFAMMLHLTTPTSAGIIAILSLQNTRRETFSLVAKRIFVLFAMAVALTVFFSDIQFGPSLCI